MTSITATRRNLLTLSISAGYQVPADWWSDGTPDPVKLK